MQIGKRDFKETGKAYLMGILNVTPDSFSDGGRYDSKERILSRVSEMIREGADIIDIGGESTRPGALFVPFSEELERVLPAVSLIKSEFDVPVSVDTRKAEVAKKAIEEGADLINDVSGLRFDPGMGRVLAKASLPCCLMHDRGEQSEETEPERYLSEVLEEMAEIASDAVKVGIKRDNIILDPGIGFHKTYDQNMILLANLSRLKELSFPILLGVSRKSVIGKALELPVEEREEATIALSLSGLNSGVNFLRVHNVKGNRRALSMMEALSDYRV
ncbi:MAG: dihydropteroate synthase [Lachnospiraceae bacterium]|nr:dihydropteroate synthase [Lachnospiraceae bacterium]